MDPHLYLPIFRIFQCPVGDRILTGKGNKGDDRSHYSQHKHHVRSPALD